MRCQPLFRGEVFAEEALLPAFTPIAVSTAYMRVVRAECKVSIPGEDRGFTALEFEGEPFHRPGQAKHAAGSGVYEASLSRREIQGIS